MAKWLWLSAVVVIFDQISKLIANSQLAQFESVAVLPSFNLTLMYNTGAAFSFLADSGDWGRWFFLILGLAMSIFLIVWLIRLERTYRLQALAVALIIGGALGNVIDRLLYGHVIDFIDLYHTAFSGWLGFSQNGHWAVFNIADSAICVGVVFLLVDMFRGSPQTASKPTG